MLAVVTRGSLTRYAAEDCSAETYPSCVAFAENADDWAIVRNEDAGEAELIVVLLTPRRPT